MKLKHNNKGFSLVELIVVIAIMAILAGVGTAGYSKYIEQTNKKADMALVGNIERAIEIGTYSTSFQMDDTLTLAQKGTKIPVGFIVLKDENSGSLQTLKSSASTCKISEEEKTFTVLGEKKWALGVGNYYETETHKGYYCETHASFVSQDFTYKYKESKFSYPDKTVTTNDTVYNIADLKADHTNNDKKYSYSSDSATTSSDVLTNILESAYGENYASQLKLRYDGWTNATLPAFYTNSVKIWDDIQSLTTLLDVASDENGFCGWPLNTYLHNGGYDNNAEMLMGIANRFEELGEEGFVAAWKNVDNLKAGDSYTGSFGELAVAGNANGREHYSAARSAYNRCFANYVSANDSDTHKSSHITAIENFGQGFQSIGLTLPEVVCNASFSKVNGLTSNGKICEECTGLYKKYVESGASIENAKAIYNMMVTVNETADKAYVNGNAEEFFKYYDEDIQSVQNLYQEALEASKGNSIVISVYYENEQLTYDVSPKEADPRANGSDK